MEHFDWIKGFAFPYVNFFIFAVVLAKLAKKPIEEALEGRKKAYERLYDQAKREKEKAENMLSDLNKRVAGLSEELDDIRKVAIKSAEKNASKIEKNAHQIATRLVEDAKLMASHEAKIAQEELLSEVLIEVRKKVALNMGKADAPEQLNKLLLSQISGLSESVDRLKGA